MAASISHLSSTLVLSLIIVFAMIDTSHGKPVKRSTNDNCQGTECYVNEQYVYDDTTPDTRLLQDINSSISEIPPMLGTMVQIQQDMKRMQELFLNNSIQLQQESLQELSNMNNLINKQLVHQVSSIPRHCSDVPSSGLYEITPSIPLGSSSGTPLSFPVLCDMDASPGGWLVFQKRFEGSVNFDRNWVDYENGFGLLDGEFWLGLSKLHVLTSNNQWQFRADLYDFEGNHTYAVYDNFQIGDSSSFYRLTIGSYIQGNAGDAMRRNNVDLNGMAFTTKDEDHDMRSYGNCGVRQRSGWWHRHCTVTYVNPNGLYLGQDGDSYTGMTWYYWKNNLNSLKKTELKIRPVN